MLIVRHVHFRSYRSLRELHLPLRRQTVFVGANNVGKTSVLEALDAILGTGRRGFGFTELDVSTGVSAEDGLEVVVTICPSVGSRFSDEETALFGMHVDLGTTPHQVMLAATAQLDDEGVFRTSLTYRKADGGDDGVVRVSERQRMGFLLLPALRNARHEVSDRSGLWSRLTQLQPISDETRASVDELGRNFGRTVVEALLGAAAQTRLDEQVAGLVAQVLYADQPGASLEFSLVPLDVGQALRTAEIRLVTPGATGGRPLTEQSVGTQSVALFGLFRAYLEAVGQSVVSIGIEEPEAHLHPHATRSMVRAIREVPMQTLVTTHSTAVTDAADPRDIVLLRRRGDSSVASNASGLTADDATEISRYIGRAGSDFLFARAVLIVEGDSERLSLPVFATSMGYDLDGVGVSIVAVDGHKFEPFLQLLGPAALSVPVGVACDNDAAAVHLCRQLRRIGMLPSGVDVDNPSRALMQAAAFTWWTVTDFESVLISHDARVFADAMQEINPGAFAQLSTTYAAELGSPNPPDADDAAFLAWAVKKPSMSKPAIARRVAELYVERDIAPPAEIAQVLTAIVEQAIAEARVTTGADGPAAGS